MDNPSIFTINSPIHAFFKKAHEDFISLSYEDIRMMPQFSSIHPSQIELHTKLTRNITLASPLVSAAMDTVTEAKAAIQMAKSGGIGIIHKNFHPDKELDAKLQLKEVHKVKHCLHACISEPVAFPKTTTLEYLLHYKAEREFKFDTFIVTNEDNSLAGLITHSIIKYNRHNPGLKLEEIMVRDVFTRKKCTIKEAYELMLRHQIGTIVMVDDHLRVTGMYVFKDVENVITHGSTNYTTDSQGRLRVGAAVGMADDERVANLVIAGVDVLVLDSAHGDSLYVLDALKRYKKAYPNLDIIAGNISTEDAAERLIRAGADALKVGQGPGQICSTRIISGIGVMQADAVYRVASVASKYEVPVIADGGIRYSGDIPIALAVGAQSVMLGQLLAGCKESPGERIQEEGKLYKIYRGMASIEAMSIKGGSERYQKAATELKKLVPEGITKRVPYKGPLEEQLFLLIEGCKTGFGYCGAHNLAQFKSKAYLSRIMIGGIRESHPDTQGMVHSSTNYP